jgi:hypothetical protein
MRLSAYIGIDKKIMPAELVGWVNYKSQTKNSLA